MVIGCPALDQLPADVLWVIVLQDLSVLDLSRLSQTCRLLHRFVEEFGWRVYAKLHAEPFPSLTPALEHSKWTIKDLLRNQNYAEKAWRARKFITRPLGPEWSIKYHPMIAISSSRLVVAAGNTLFLYRFMPPSLQHTEQPRIKFEHVVTFPKDARKDFTGVSFVGAEDRDLLVSCANGALARVQLPLSLETARRRRLASHTAAPVYFREYGHQIRALSTAQTAVLTMDSAGVASFYSLTDLNLTLASSVDLGSSAAATGWSAHLSLQSRSGYAAMGTASPTPLTVHNFTETGLLAFPQTILSPSTEPSSSFSPTAVYSICGVTQTFSPVTSSSQVVVSGWYHGAINVHDLRCPSHTEHEAGYPILPPALTMRDPVVLSPIYSVTSSGPRIVGGSARHSLLHLYDVRFTKGWSIYLPQTQRRYSASSPVHSCLLESTRLWAATDSRAFVVDFGQGFNGQAYPSFSGNVGTGSIREEFYEHDFFRDIVATTGGPETMNF